MKTEYAVAIAILCNVPPLDAAHHRLKPYKPITQPP
jgi:hypothetical protein